jgi:hypothetical protein
MLLRHRVPPIPSTPPARAGGLEHLDDRALAVLRWLADNRVDFILVGPVARQIRGERGARGPVCIVAAPYGRNLDRLARALNAARARLRHDGDGRTVVHGDDPGAAIRDRQGETADAGALKLTAERLLSGQRWTLRCGDHDLDIEAHPPSGPRYQELLYEATRFELAEGLWVEVGAPEDIEHYEHVRRTGVAPEIRISRAGG